MTREEMFKKLCERMSMPENEERYHRCVLHPDKASDDYLIEMHCRHIREYLEVLKSELELNQRVLIEVSCDTALKALKALLDKNNWVC